MDQVRLFALGGLDEDGKNMYVVEVGESIFVIEAGLKYPESTDQLGIERIIPDFKYLIENQHRIQAIFISHGHDDVMAALPNLLRHVKAPVYSTPLTAMLIEEMLKKEGLREIRVHRVKRNSSFKIAVIVLILVIAVLLKIFVFRKERRYGARVMSRGRRNYRGGRR